MKLVVIVFVCCVAALAAGNALPEREINAEATTTDENDTHTRNKRTLFLKKKLIGAGILGFGLGVAKGLKFGYHGYPDVHHVYSSPPVRYVEYVEKPVFVQRIIEKPVFKQSHADYESWSPHETSYGSW